MTLGYLRVSTDKQTVENQRNEILNYCNNNSLNGKVEWLEVKMSTRKSERDRKLDELFDKIKSGDTVIVSEMSRLGRSTQEVLQTIDKLMSHKVELHIVKQKLVVNPNNKNDFISKAMITLMSLFAELERDLISQRTKEALKARKALGIELGKPKGTIQASKYDEHKNRIIELKELGLSLNKIVKNHLEPVMGKSNCSVQSLSTYLKKRGL
ncbi:recombinase family protein [Arcobacter arenosus]|uniref:Resolvase n=1 Tax=Arcobacter arenosus TaxID=2576037 RepID=A0A5R8XYG3_9BACT|nr:recombinase family protein [Arcobacter arenosus]TLP36158.1 resolvase [Arcobacter arenosus]